MPSHQVSHFQPGFAHGLADQAVQSGRLDLWGNRLHRRPNGFWTTGDVPATAFSEDQHEACAMLEEESFWFWHRNRLILWALAAFPAEGPILDLGAGNGFVSRAIQDSGILCLAVEPGVAGAEACLGRGIRNVVWGTLEGAGFPAGSVPAIGAFDVLEHIEDDRAFLRSALSSLSPNGRLYLTVPALNWLWSVADVEAGHYRRYSRASIMRLLASVGAEVEYCGYAFSYLVLPLLLLRAIPTRLGFLGTERVRSGMAHRRRFGATPLLKWLGGLEMRIVRSGYSVPAGTSLVVIARKASSA